MRLGRLAILGLLVLAACRGAAAQTGGSKIASALSCLAEPDNQDADIAIAQNCGSLQDSLVTSNTANMAFDCPKTCGSAFNALTATCKNMLASDDAVGATYRIVFENCDVTYSGGSSSNSTASPTPTAPTPTTPTPDGVSNATSAVNTSEFQCLTTAQNLNASERFVQSCTGGALQPKEDSSSALGFTVSCPADCASALKDVSKSCLDTIAAGEDFGQIYQQIFTACGVSFDAPANSTSNSTTTTSTAAPTTGNSTTTAAPSSSATASDTAAAPTSGATASTAAAPAPAPQAGSCMVSGLATWVAIVATGCATLVMLT